MIRVMLGVAATVVLASGAAAQSSVERGDYLMNTIMTCANCHSPKGPPAATAGKDYSGGLSWDEPPFKVTAPNITTDKESGIGDWTDAEIKTAITQGKRKDGTPLKGPMGYQYYAKMTDADLEALITYLRTVPPKE